MRVSEAELAEVAALLNLHASEDVLTTDRRFQVEIGEVAAGLFRLSESPDDQRGRVLTQINDAVDRAEEAGEATRQLLRVELGSSGS